MQPADIRLGDWTDRRYCYGNVYRQPFVPWSGPLGAPVTTDVRLGDYVDRRRMYGSGYYAQPMSYAPIVTDVRLGDTWDRRRTFGNVVTMPFYPWSGTAVDGRLGDMWDRSRVYGYVPQVILPQPQPAEATKPAESVPEAPKP